MAQIKVDVREPSLIDALRAANCDSVLPQQLTIGDVHIESSDGTRSMLVELKTVADLSASIMDGRHASQRSRLIAERLASGTSLAYVIRSQTSLAEVAPRVSSAIASLVARYQIAVIRSGSVEETAKIVMAFAQQLERPPPDNAGLASTYVSQGSLVHVSKKKNLMVDNNAWIAMLACVPGVSARMAVFIAQEAFRCAADVMKCERGEAVRKISEVKVPMRTALLRTPKQKSVGDVVAERVVSALNGEPFVTPTPTPKKRKGVPES